MKSYNITSKSKRQYLREKKKLLRDFNIKVTPAIVKRISELYPNDVAVENYTRKVILDRLEK